MTTGADDDDDGEAERTGQETRSRRICCDAIHRCHCRRVNTLHSVTGQSPASATRGPSRALTQLVHLPKVYRADHSLGLRHSWHKVKLKTSDASAPPSIGLVPASYLAPCAPLRTVQALYDYTPARNDATGELENDEEMEIAEGEELLVMEESEDEWILVQRGENGGCGFVPSSYVGVSDRVDGPRNRARS